MAARGGLRILVLCHGNMCRSPAAEAVLRRHTEADVWSRGFRISAGRAAKKVRDALAERGYDLEYHVPRPVEPRDLERAELILYMDQGNLDRLTKMATRGQLERARCLGAYAGLRKIPDPNFMPRGSTGFKRAVLQLVLASQECARAVNEGRALADPDPGK